MWILLFIAVLAGCAAAPEKKPYGFWEAYAPYMGKEGRCRQNCPLVPLTGPSQLAPSIPLDDLTEPLPTMLRTPSGALYHRYGNIIVDPDGGITTLY